MEIFNVKECDFVFAFYSIFPFKQIFPKGGPIFPKNSAKICRIAKNERFTSVSPQ